MFVRKPKDRKTKTAVEKRNCQGHSQSNQEYVAGQLVTPSAGLRFAVERSQSQIEAAAVGETECPLCREAAEINPQDCYHFAKLCPIPSPVDERHPRRPPRL